MAAASAGFCLLLLAGALAVAATQEDKSCCFYGDCGGSCQDGVGTEHWCGVSEDQCAQCSGAWCLGGSGPADPHPLGDNVPYKEEGRPILNAGGSRSGAKCCFWSENGDMCGNCQSASTGDEWCAANKQQCDTCAGTWCPDGALSSPSPTQNPPPTPSPEVSPSPKAPEPSPGPEMPIPPGEWIEGTWTTGYWDCCKPSCGWANKGYMTQPVKSCRPDGSIAGIHETSVCGGGTAGSCVDNQPWVVGPNLSYGFAAAAVGGPHGLKGDENCAQCFELVFTAENGKWEGAHPDLVGRTHVVQVTNIGYDVSGGHSFDLQIPGAGQGAFPFGCVAQFPGYAVGDFDCENNYGGCDAKSGCDRLPEVLQPGCRWRYDWYRWLVDGGRTFNPYVRFRRVRCPKELTNITGSIPLDDDQYAEFVL